MDFTIKKKREQSPFSIVIILQFSDRITILLKIILSLL